MDGGCNIATFKGGLEWMRRRQKIFSVGTAASDACGDTFCVKAKVI